MLKILDRHNWRAFEVYGAIDGHEVRVETSVVIDPSAVQAFGSVHAPWLPLETRNEITVIYVASGLSFIVRATWDEVSDWLCEYEAQLNGDEPRAVIDYEPADAEERRARVQRYRDRIDREADAYTAATQALKSAKETEKP